MAAQSCFANSFGEEGESVAQAIPLTLWESIGNRMAAAIVHQQLGAEDIVEVLNMSCRPSSSVG
jgi:hypothetical protein